MGGGRRHSGNGWRVRCPVHGGQDRNLSIKDGSSADVIVRCFSHGCDPVAILRAIEAAGGREPDQRRGRPSKPPPINANDRSKLDYLLSKLLRIEGTVVQTYLRSRGLDLPPDGHHLRFLPANPLKYPWPCMVGIITDFLDAGRIMSLHLTRLRADGQGKRRCRSMSNDPSSQGFHQGRRHSAL